MIEFLKGLPNLMLYFIIWGVLAFWLKRNRHKLATLVIVLGILFFLVCSTNYVPKKLIASIENAYDPIDLQQLDLSKPYYIHVLGSGSASDERLPALMNISQETLTRLTEGIRVFLQLERAILVTSAASKKGLKSQAELSKEAAESLGVNEANIRMLKTPTTTLEEALAFKAEFGADNNIILVTSALHMPRAVKIFADQGLSVIPAPTSYLYKEGPNSYNGIAFPTFKSMELMNIYHITLLKDWYYTVFKKE